MTTDYWNDDRVEQLKALLADGMSASRIAFALGGGLTRNAVIGKLRRMGLPGGGAMSTRPKSNAPRLASDRVVNLAPAKAKRVMLRQAARADEPAPLLTDAGEPVTLRDAASKQCRWMPGDEPGDQQICAHPTVPGEPWCPHHAGRVREATAAPTSQSKLAPRRQA